MWGIVRDCEGLGGIGRDCEGLRGEIGLVESDEVGS